MHEARIVCGGVAAPKQKDVIELDLSPNAPAYRRIDFNTTRLCAPLVDDLPDVLADAVELAAYLYCADRLVKRGGTGRGIGSEWQRNFRVQIPVRRIDLWQRPNVQLALRDALTFLSGDTFIFEFSKAAAPMSVEPFLGFGDQNAQTVRPDKVLLFSGGLDSLAGVARDVIGAGQKAILVTHQSANALIDLQNQLAQQIMARTTPRSVLHLPIRLRRGHDQPREHSQRLRSFLFATLGMAYAHMFGLREVQFYENGITSFNLPIAEHVIGTRASRTTHPQLLYAYGTLFSLLLGESVSFVNPFLWKTKTDVVRLIVQNGAGDLIRLTTSCASVRAYSMTRQQCGVCSQCVERRIAMVAADAVDLDEGYASDMFLGPIEQPIALTMIGGHLLRARRLAKIARPAFFSNHGQAFRAFEAAGQTAAAAAEQTFLLHARYGKEFIDAVELVMSRNATIDGLRSIQDRSMLGMLQNRPSNRRHFADPTESEPPASIQALAIAQVRRPEIVLAIDRRKGVVTFRDGPVLGGNGYRIIDILLRHQEEWAAAGNPPEDCPFLPTKSMISELHMEDKTFRQNVLRLRDKLGRKFESCTGYTLDREDVFQSQNWQGYRLNPHVLVTPRLPATKIGQASRKSATSVTTSNSPL
jgi:7-cyano-7-deazaguanine synthase in queuosine biosynthesis